MRMVDDTDWDSTLVTHYTGIGTEVREYKPAKFAQYTDSLGWNTASPRTQTTAAQ